MYIEAGEPLHTLIANAIITVVVFLLGMQVGSVKNEHKKSN